MLESGMTQQQIGRALGMTTQRVRDKIRGLSERPIPRTADARKRNCLRCRAIFWARTRFIFMCDPCKVRL